MFGHASDELHHERQVVLVAIVVLPTSGVEQHVPGGELENDARETPHISARVILRTEDDLGRAILSRLNVLRELAIDPARVTQITNFRVKILQRVVRK